MADCLGHAAITTSAVSNNPFLSPNRLLFSYLFLYFFTPVGLKLTIMSHPFVFHCRMEAHDGEECKEREGGGEVVEMELEERGT